MDGLAIAASITEAKGAILGGVIRTIYQPEFGTFVLHLFAGGDRRFLLSPGRAALHLTNLDLAYPQRPSPFTMLLRKHLRGGRIVGIEQSGWDRVVNLTVERRQGENLEAFHVIVELLGVRGNLILLRDDRVLAALRPGTRVVSGAVYQPLPSQEKIDPSKITLALLEEILEREEPVRALVHHVDGIGRKTAEAIITRAQARADGSFAEGIRESLSFLLVRVKEPQAEVDRATNSASFFPLVPPGERYPSFSAALDAEWGERHEAVQNDGAQKPLREGILRAIAKRERTVKKLKEWLAKADAAETLQQHADLIMIHQRTLTRRMREATLLDPARGERVAIPLNPRLNPIENAQALYERAKRLRRGRPIVTQRLRRLEGEIARLREGVATLESGAGLSDDLLALIPTPRTRKTPPPPTAPRVFAILGYTVQVGKDAAQNDALLRSASPEDLWLHAKGVPGSHVFVRHHGRRTGYPPEVVRKAALLAARFSKAREERWVEVSYTTVKHVRKPKGSPPGLVILSKEETLTVDLRNEEEGE